MANLKTAAWTKMHSKGSKDAVARLNAAKASDPEYQAWLQSSGNGAITSKTQAKDSKPAEAKVTPITKNRPEVGGTDRLALIRRAAAKRNVKDASGNLRDRFGGSQMGDSAAALMGRSFRSYSEEVVTEEDKARLAVIAAAAKKRVVRDAARNNRKSFGGSLKGDSAADMLRKKVCEAINAKKRGE